MPSLESWSAVNATRATKMTSPCLFRKLTIARQFTSRRW